ncbi:serine/threonine protein kinase [Nocardia transvalensis]|uniref:non-specific serine/threonine protein kinase n=1 Tax=Nocardia transvalensis TaxID=37333 RepID=A0A7W9PJC9_9NOCA|nr:serine/threonine-protein kinase [Nocardia transvalensis]MBB5917246.1 serine/threonine protein kinase [Nocardia transvalensis]
MVHPEIGTTFADYVIDGVLGHGGMGTVYLARHPRLPRSVALKVLNRAVSGDAELRKRFEREAGVVARLEHPNIVGIYDRGTHDGCLWVAMQYIEGGDTGRLDPRQLTGERAARIITDTASALDYAHAHGVLHRDIKPANILLSAADAGRAERAVLTDFGIARMDAATKITVIGTFTATLAFAAPEQLSGEPLDHRADQYSLACTLFSLLTGRPPFTADNPGQVVAQHLSAPVPPLGPLRPDLPAGLDAVLARGMAKEREQRFGSCGEFAAAVWEALSGRSAVVPLPPETAVRQHVSAGQRYLPPPSASLPGYSSPPRIEPGQPVRRGRRGALAAAIVAVLVVGAGVTYALRESTTKSIADSPGIGAESVPETTVSSHPGGWSDSEQVVVQAFPKVFSDPVNRKDWRGADCTGTTTGQTPEKSGITCTAADFTLSIYDLGDAVAAVDYLGSSPPGVNWIEGQITRRGFMSFLPYRVSPDSDFGRPGTKFFWGGFSSEPKFARYVLLIEMDADSRDQLVDVWGDVPL